MPNFTYATLSDAQMALAARLYDSGMQQWAAGELTLAIVEALRNWNALTSFWRAEFNMPLKQGVWWYDITDPTVAPNTLRPHTVTDNYLVQAIEYHLLEPPTPTYPLTWSGSKQFSVPGILDAITRRQNEVLGATGCTVTRQLVDAPIVRAGILLPDTTIDIRRVTWLPAAGMGFSPTILKQSDVWAKRSFDSGYTVRSQQPPFVWMQATEPPPRFDVDNVPPVTGQYELLCVRSGGVASAVSPPGAQPLSVPDDWSWIVKWGALGDLLSRESNAKDTLRAEYCQKRYTEGLQFLSSASSILSLQVNGIPLFVDAVTNGDRFNSQWQAAAQGPPQSCYTTGLNLVGFPAPDAGPYGALLSVVQNAPVPVNPGDYIQVARSDYDSILDMAQHIAMFKLGGEEFAATIPLYQKFLDRAAVYNRKLKAMGQFQWALADVSRTEEERNPRMEQEQ